MKDRSPEPRIGNRVAEFRKQQGISAAQLAERANVTRQTIYAIEAGTYVPNTRVALHLARELEVTVDELFSLPETNRTASHSLAAELLSATAVFPGQAIRTCRVGSRRIAAPVSAAPYYLPEADGLVSIGTGWKTRSEVVLFANENSAKNRLVLAGCDPASALLTSMVQKISGVEVVSAAASSKLALRWLSEGKVHIAGSHLEDAGTGEFNLPFLRSEFPGMRFSVVTFARWEEGLVVANGNPKSLRTIEDIARPNVTLINRESGSGSRALLDKLLKRAGVKRIQVNGYQQVAYGHLAAAWSVSAGSADVCLATRAAAQTFGLDFVPLCSERYDLILREETVAAPAVQALLDVVQRAALRRKLEMFAGYDTSQTGQMLAQAGNERSTRRPSTR